MNQVPKSLRYPLLRDAIVEFRYLPLVSADLLPGIFYERLRKQGWELPADTSGHVFDLGLQFKATTKELPTFFKDDCRLQILDGSLNFNITSDYRGWASHYRPIIAAATQSIFDNNLLTLVRVGLRYINDLPDVDVFTLTDRFLPKTPSGFATDSQAVRWTLMYEETAAIVNLANQLGSFGAPLQKSNSVVDVDLHCKVSTESSADEALEVADRLHELNKEIVFGYLLPEEYVLTREPSY